MFDLTDAPRLWINVKWPGLIPGPDEGLAVETEHEVELEVEIVDRDELLILFPLRPERANTPEEEAVIFKRLCSAWRKFKIAGQTAEFSDENIKKLCKVPMFATGFELAYMAAWQGRGVAREKNSEGSPSIGRAGTLQGAKGTTSSSAIAAASE